MPPRLKQAHNHLRMSVVPRIVDENQDVGCNSYQKEHSHPHNETDQSWTVCNIPSQSNIHCTIIRYHIAVFTAYSAIDKSWNCSRVPAVHLTLTNITQITKYICTCILYVITALCQSHNKHCCHNFMSTYLQMFFMFQYFCSCFAWQVWIVMMAPSCSVVNCQTYSLVCA